MAARARAARRLGAWRRTPIRTRLQLSETSLRSRSSALEPRLRRLNLLLLPQLGSVLPQSILHRHRPEMLLHRFQFLIHLLNSVPCRPRYDYYAKLNLPPRRRERRQLYLLPVCYQRINAFTRPRRETRASHPYHGSLRLLRSGPTSRVRRGPAPNSRPLSRLRRG